MNETEIQEETCEGCEGTGENWQCMGENDPEDCTCKDCSDIEECQECDGTGAQ